MAEGVSTRPKRAASKRAINDENTPPSTPEEDGGEQEFDDDSVSTSTRTRRQSNGARGTGKRRRSSATTGSQDKTRGKKKTTANGSSSAAAASANGGEEEEQEDDEDKPDSVNAEKLLASTSKDFFGASRRGQLDAYYELEENERDRRYLKLLRLVFLQCICGGRPLRKKDLTEVILTQRIAMPMLDRVNCTLRKKFGLELVPLLQTMTVESTARSLVFVSGRSYSDYIVVIANRDDDDFPAPVSYESRKTANKELPRTDQLYRSMAMIVMSIVLLQDEQYATAELIKTTLTRIDGRFASKRHPTFGEWESIVFRQFVDDGMLDTVRENNETYYYIGPVARSEIGAANVYDFAHRLTEGENMREAKLENALRKETLGDGEAAST